MSSPSTAQNVELWPIARLVEYPRNPRKNEGAEEPPEFRWIRVRELRQQLMGRANSQELSGTERGGMPHLLADGARQEAANRMRLPPVAFISSFAVTPPGRLSWFDSCRTSAERILRARKFHQDRDSSQPEIVRPNSFR